MRSTSISGANLPLVRTPSARQQAGRRWMAAICAVLGLALLSLVFGAVTAPGNEDDTSGSTGPFSYFPSQ